MKTLYLINHSHTDIGYTAVQEEIMQYHVAFIDQAIAMIEEQLAHNTENPEVWTCENYWQVQNFLENSTPEQIAKFEKYVELGYIDFSLNYLNMNELVEPSIMDHFVAEAHTYAQKFTSPHDSAMTADINGFSWGYGESLAANGCQNLFTCIHSHHGLYPLYQNQLPFWWETPTGKKLLVWSGEHYQFGNETYLMPHAEMTYFIEDTYNGVYDIDPLIVAESRVFGYFNDLEKRGYPYDFAPIMVSGFGSDNAGPNEDFAGRISEWNDKFGDQITVKNISLNQFFQILRKENLDELPVYRGDWNDWWADGAGSTPAATKIYRNAVKNYRLLEHLGEQKLLDSPLGLSAKENLMLFAEHTWGYSSSVSEPWNSLVNELEYRKLAYSANASTDVGRLKIKALMNDYGYVMPSANRLQHFKIINPFDQAVTQDVRLTVEAWEHFGDVRIADPWLDFYEVYNLETGEIYPCQIERTARNYDFSLTVSLAPKEILQVGIRMLDHSTMKKTYWPFLKAAENVKDIVYPGKENDFQIESDYFSVVLDNDKGIADIVYKPTNQSIIDPEALYPAFSGIYEKTDILTDACQERRRMGRNRKGKHAKRYASVIKNIEVLQRGDVFTKILVEWDLVGTGLFSYELKVYNKIAKIECLVRVSKTNEWAPENLYVSLPFMLNSERYFKKSGALLRPAVDQLPGTNTEFYLLDTGVEYLGADGVGLAVNVKDAPLVMIGDLEHHPIELFSEKMVGKNAAPMYSWPMNNYWETNFKVDLSGFYEFKYSLVMANNMMAIEDVDALLDTEHLGLIVVPI